MMLTQFPSWRTWDVKGVEHEADVRVGGNCVSIVRLTLLDGRVSSCRFGLQRCFGAWDSGTNPDGCHT